MLELLKEYGADVEGAMARMLYDKEFYMECIHTFLHDHYFIELKQALEISDYHAAFACAHTLKGVAANLGLTPVYDAVCDVVEPLRKEEPADYISLYAGIEARRNALEKLIDGFIE